MAEPAPEMVGAVADAYFAKEIGAPSAARERAQRAFSISGAIATTLLAAGVFTDVATSSDLVKIVGLVTLLLWVVAGSLFTYAVASPVRRVGQDKRSEASEFVSAVLDGAKRERAEIDCRSKWAHGAAGLALLATVATLLLILFGSVPTSKGKLLLAHRGATDVRQRCPDAVRGNWVEGEVQVTTLDEDFVVIEPAGNCRSAHVRLRVPQEDVLIESS